MASQKEWERRIRRWRKSGLTSKAFAAREGLNPNTLLWWSSRLQTQPTFVEVTAEPLPLAGTELEVVLSNGRTIRVPSSFDGAHLERLVAALERA